MRRYRIEHTTTYRYSDLVSASYGRGYLRPREFDGQHVVEHLLTVTPAPTDLHENLDVYGNVDTFFHVTTGHEELEVCGVTLVEVHRQVPDVAAAALPWEQAIPVGAVDDVESLDFVGTSPMVPRLAEAGQYAADIFTPGRPLGECVLELTRRIHADFTYQSGATSIDTSIPELLAAREGVCQDFAHLAVAALRAHGLPARYVSGYLATDPPPGKERMIGVDATHAWASVRLPVGDWLDFDPTNDQLADDRYTTVAWGRDYADVPPLRGVIYTDATSSTLDVSVDVEPL